MTQCAKEKTGPRPKGKNRYNFPNACQFCGSQAQYELEGKIKFVCANHLEAGERANAGITDNNKGSEVL